MLIMVLHASLAWMEMHSIITKLIYTYDFELVDPTLDWHQDSEMHTQWKKPRLMVRVRRRPRQQQSDGLGKV